MKGNGVIAEFMLKNHLEDLKSMPKYTIRGASFYLNSILLNLL